MPKLVNKDKVTPHERPNAKGREMPKSTGRPCKGWVPKTMRLPKETFEWFGENKLVLIELALNNVPTGKLKLLIEKEA
jgi:hypothetical protein